MKTTPVILTLALFAVVTASAQTDPTGTSSAAQPAPEFASAGPGLDAILQDLQGVIDATARDLNALRIDRWKTENAQKQQIIHATDSLQKNLATIMPGPAGNLSAEPRSVIQSFRLYHNLNLVYEFLNEFADAAGSFGRQEEHNTLAADAASLDRLRHSLAKYTEQTANLLEADLRESKAREAVLAARLTAAMQAGAPRKVVVDGPSQAKKSRKAARKTSPVNMP